MKTITTLLTGMILLLSAANSNAQSASNDEDVTFETLVRIADNDLVLFAISPLRIENASSGFAVKWQTRNENSIAGFELQMGETKNNFTTIKKMAPAVSPATGKIYAAAFNNTIILSDKVYFRVKTNFTDGKISYSDIAAVKISNAK